MLEFLPVRNVEASEAHLQRRRVKESVDRLNIGFRVERHPELWSALAETGEHFDDAVCMAREIDAVWDKLELKGISREKMMLCALLHDVGKAGPEKRSTELHRAIKQLFAPPRKPFNPFRQQNGRTVPKTIRDFMEETEMRGAFEVEAVLEKELKIKSDAKPIIDFWRDHADWTYDLLSHHREGEVDDDVVTIASTHHVLEGRNPAHVPLDDIHPGSKVLELMDKYQTLAMIDKYQAFRGRGGLDHEKAIEALRRIIEANKTLDTVAKQEYGRIIDVLASSEEELTETLVRPEITEPTVLQRAPRRSMAA